MEETDIIKAKVEFLLKDMVDVPVIERGVMYAIEYSKVGRKHCIHEAYYAKIHNKDVDATQYVITRSTECNTAGEPSIAGRSVLLPNDLYGMKISIFNAKFSAFMYGINLGYMKDKWNQYFENKAREHMHAMINN